jgi:hypothetical protein
MSQPFFLGLLQQASAFLASATFSLAAFTSSLALSLMGVSQSFFSCPFISLQVVKSGLIFAAAIASSTAVFWAEQSGLSSARAPTTGSRENITVNIRARFITHLHDSFRDNGRQEIISCR